jgi:hypothetical protein
MVTPPAVWASKLRIAMIRPDRIDDLGNSAIAPK